MTKQPYALEIVDWLENEVAVGYTDKDVARELRRLHEVNAELLAALEQALPEIDCGTHSGDRAWDAVKAAITKSQGETE